MEKITLHSLRQKKVKQERFAAIAVYDATLAKLCGNAEIDIALVGDSLGMLVQGHSTTVAVTLDDIIYHGKALARADTTMLRMLDMPFMSYCDTQTALSSAKRLMQEGHAECIKVEVNAKQLPIIQALANNSVPTCTHLGLLPQTIHQLGRYRSFGKAEAEKTALLEQAKAVESAGADLLLLECVDADLAKTITQSVQIPVIGIGSGPDTDGQILVIYDLLGASTYLPRFAKNFLTETNSLAGALSDYRQAVIENTFPPRA